MATRNDTQERPTPTVQRIDMSASHHGASAAPADPEHALFYAHRHDDVAGIEQRPCACGGTVHADPLAPARGVQAHNFTGRHKAWRLNREDAD